MKIIVPNQLIVTDNGFCKVDEVQNHGVWVNDYTAFLLHDEYVIHDLQ